MKVLLADDDIDLLNVMKDFLEANGFSVATAVDGEEALESFRREMPDIAILDFLMPKKNGFEVFMEIKKDPAFEYLPVVLLSGGAQKQTRVEGLNLGAADFLSKPVDMDELLARLRMIIKRNREVLAVNPLTHLPGNVSIETRINEALEKQAPLAVLYIDLDQFKAYNDAYGFEAGDRVIRKTANLLLRVAKGKGREENFIGHIGGDDFIVLTRPDTAEELSQLMVAEFRELAPGFYRPKDRKQGYITSTDRTGKAQNFPFVSISIGVVTSKARELTSLGQISLIGTELKKYAKRLGGNRFAVDRRKD